jgi:energy-coupling factor transporter transmembrane protein EcfT
LRLLSAAILLALCVLLIASTRDAWLFSLGGVSLAAHFLVAGNRRRGLIALWPVLLFSGILIVLQWAGGAISWALPVKTIGVFGFVSATVRLLPWVRWTRRIEPGNSLYAPVLFLIIVMHFVTVLGDEVRRALVARTMAVPLRYGPGCFRSLSWAVAGIVRRTLERAERFYAAQSLRGLDA